MSANAQLPENAGNKVLDNVRLQGLTLPTVKRKLLQAEEVVEMLKKKQGDRSLRQFATVLDITPAYLSDIYRGRRYPGEKVLSQLGLVKVLPEPMYETV